MGSNRNIELRREFAADVDTAPIRATSILNGAFMDLLTGQAPMISFERKRVLYWSSPDQMLDFTTKDDVARITARVALNQVAPRTVEVAGDRRASRHSVVMTELTGTPFTLPWAGTTTSLSGMSKVMRRLTRDTDEPFPA